MEKESSETVTGVSMKERRLEKKKQRTGHHRRYMVKEQSKNLMKKIPRRQQMKQKKLNMKLTSQQPVRPMQQQCKSMQGRRQGSQPSLWARA